MLANSIFRSSLKMTTPGSLSFSRPNPDQPYNKLLNNYFIPTLGRKTLMPQNIYAFSKYKPPLSTEIDTANLIGYINSSDSPFLLFREKLSEFSMGSMYHGLYDFSRQLLFTLANDYHLGIPLSIVVISAAVRLIFIYPTVMGQLNGLKMKQIQAETKRYKQKLSLGQKTGNLALSKQAQRQYKKVQLEHGIGFFIPMLNLLQLPFLITWFLQLRDLANLGQLYPQLYNSSFLWITDLTAMDYLLPIIAAGITSLSLYYSPSLKKGNAVNVFIQKYCHLMPLLPFFSLLFTIWFPSTLNIYWGTIACAQLVVSLLLNYQPLLTRLGYTSNQQRVINIPQTKYLKAVFIDQKKPPKSGDKLDVDKQQKDVNNSQKTSFSDVKSNQEHILVVRQKPKKNKSENQMQRPKKNQ